MVVECKLTVTCRPSDHEEQVTTFPTQFQAFRDGFMASLMPGGKIELPVDTTQVRWVVERVKETQS